MSESTDLLSRLARARCLLAEVREERISIAEAARAANISRFHFIREFEAAFGATPHQFRVDARLWAAKLLLAQGERSVTDVCMEVGMSSLGSFSDLFTRRMGETPTSYRLRARSMVTVPGSIPAEMFPGCLSLMSRLPADAFRNFREANPA